MSEAQLYFSEFTMPDGNKRRPLFEREPKMRPEGLGDPEQIEDTPAIAFRYAQQALDGGYRNRVGIAYAPLAAALCRCSVHDWLMYDSLAVSFEHGSKDNDVVVVPVSKAEDSHTHSGPTIHHALIAAAHSVLDAQGVAL